MSDTHLPIFLCFCALTFHFLDGVLRSTCFTGVGFPVFLCFPLSLVLLGSHVSNDCFIQGHKNSLLCVLLRTFLISAPTCVSLIPFELTFLQVPFQGWLVCVSQVFDLESIAGISIHMKGHEKFKKKTPFFTCLFGHYVWPWRGGGHFLTGSD